MWGQSGENSDDAYNARGGSGENRMPAGTSGSDSSQSDDSRQALQLRQGAKKGECTRALPRAGRGRAISSRGGVALRVEPQQAPAVEGDVGGSERQHRKHGPVNTGRPRPPQRNVGAKGGGQSGRRAPSGDQRRRLAKFLGHATRKAEPTGVRVYGGAWEATGAGARPRAGAAGPVPTCCDVCKGKAISMARLASLKQPSGSGPLVVPAMPQCGEAQPRSVHSGPFPGRSQFQVLCTDNNVHHQVHSRNDLSPDPLVGPHYESPSEGTGRR